MSDRTEPLYICPDCGADYDDPAGNPPRCMFDDTELVPLKPLRWLHETEPDRWTITDRD